MSSNRRVAVSQIVCSGWSCQGGSEFRTPRGTSRWRWSSLLEAQIRIVISSRYLYVQRTLRVLQAPKGGLLRKRVALPPAACYSCTQLHLPDSLFNICIRYKMYCLQYPSSHIKCCLLFQVVVSHRVTFPLLSWRLIDLLLAILHVAYEEVSCVSALAVSQCVLSKCSLVVKNRQFGLPRGLTSTPISSGSLLSSCSIS